MSDLSVFTNSFLGIAALVFLLVLAIAAAIMPLYVIGLHGLIKKLQREQANANAQQARLLTNIHGTLARMEAVSVSAEE